MFHCGLPHLKARKRRAVQPGPKAITFRANGFPGILVAWPRAGNALYEPRKEQSQRFNQKQSTNRTLHRALSYGSLLMHALWMFAVLITKARRRIPGDRLAMAESGSIE